MRVNEWQSNDARAIEYHLAQWKDQKRSTIVFAEFIKAEIRESVIDLGCGSGAPTAYLAREHPKAQFVGIDFSRELIDIGSELAAREDIGNLSFEVGDLYNLRAGEADGAISLQTLSWLPDFKEPMREIFQKIHPRWFAVSSLFYEGDISCKIEVTEHARERSTFYNVYAIPEVDRFARQHGYTVSKVTPFRMDIDIPKPANRDLMGTYTVGQERLQISGPLLMNWHFLLLIRVP